MKGRCRKFVETFTFEYAPDPRMWRRLFPFLVLVGLALAFRLPVLLNPERMNSDHAFIGLQGLRLLEGEWQWFLWKSDYQGSWEPLVAAFLFSLFGASFRVLQWVPLSAYFLMLGFLFYGLRRELGTGKAFLLSLTWVFVSQPILDTNVLPYRQWSLFFPCLALALAHRWGSKTLVWALAGFLPFFALYVDFFSIQFLLPVGIVLALATERQGERWRPLWGGALGGAGLLVITRWLGPESGAPLAFSPKTFIEHLPLFFQTCLPVLLGFAFPAHEAGAVAWGRGIHPFLIVTSLLLLALVMRSVERALRDRELPLWVRLFGLFGGLLLGQASVGFLGSTMASNVHSVRYLSPFICAIPFALAPLAYRLPLGTLTLWLLPYLVGIAIGGWQQNGPLVDGWRPVRDPGDWVKSAQALGAWAREQEIRYAESDYWVAYQLTFLYRENPVVVPLNVVDRYPAYGERARNEPRGLRIFTPKDPKVEVDRFRTEYRDHLVSSWRRGGFYGYVYLRR